jgi:hypothetical protein
MNVCNRSAALRQRQQSAKSGLSPISFAPPLCGAARNLSILLDHDLWLASTHLIRKFQLDQSDRLALTGLISLIDNGVTSSFFQRGIFHYAIAIAIAIAIAAMATEGNHHCCCLWSNDLA